MPTKIFTDNVGQKNQGTNTTINPTDKIAEKAVWRSVFLTIQHYILNADSKKFTPPEFLFSGNYQAKNTKVKDPQLIHYIYTFFTDRNLFTQTMQPAKIGKR